MKNTQQCGSSPQQQHQPCLTIKIQPTRPLLHLEDKWDIQSTRQVVLMLSVFGV